MPKIRPAELMVRNSEQSCWKTCRFKWRLAYVHRLRSPRPSSPLRFGTMIHKVLEIRYPPGKERGPDPVKTVKRLYARHLRLTGEELPPVKIGRTDEEDSEVGYVPALDLAVAMLEGYVAEYGADEQYEVIAPEMTYQIDITDILRRHLFTAVGTFDGLLRDLFTGKLIFIEHKTGSGLDPFGAPTTLDEQSGSYLAFGNLFLREKGLLAPNEEVDYVLFNRLKKAFPSTGPFNSEGLKVNKPKKEVLVTMMKEFGRPIAKGMTVDQMIFDIWGVMPNVYDLGEVSKRQPGPLFKRELVYRGHAEQVAIITRFGQEAREMAAARDGRMATYKNPDRHCSWCEFRDLCELHEAGGDWKGMAKAMYQRWDPYAAHEIEQERVS